MRTYALLAAAVLFTACGPSHYTGLVAMKISDTEAHVCLGEEAATPGTTIDVYRSVCRREKPYTCDLRSVGTGTIKENLNSHYAVATFPEGSTFQEGDMVRAR
jgi:hypothetical protein